MTRRIIAIRPEPGLSATIALGQELGLEITPMPLSHVEAMPWEVPAPDDFDALLVGSANAFRFGGPGLEALRHLPVHAVGETTGNAAREAGFSVAHVGVGGLQSVIDSAAECIRFLRLAGEERIDLEVPEGIAIDERVVYRVTFDTLSEQRDKRLKDNVIILLHSAGSASHLSEQLQSLKVDRSNLTLCALGPRIAEAAGSGWRDIHIADHPTDAELLALAKDICQ